MIDETLYIPFLCFYEDEMIFAYKDYQKSEYSVSHGFNQAFVSSSLDEAKKAFSKCLRGLCPKDLWNHSGIIRTTKEFLESYEPICYRRSEKHSHHHNYSDMIKVFEVVEVKS